MKLWATMATPMSATAQSGIDADLSSGAAKSVNAGSNGAPVGEWVGAVGADVGEEVGLDVGE